MNSDATPPSGRAGASRRVVIPIFTELRRPGADADRDTVPDRRTGAVAQDGFGSSDASGASNASDASDASFNACSGAESFALMVLGNSMQPEFDDGDIVIIEPGGHATDGAFVLARSGEEWGLRQLRQDGSRWLLAMLNSSNAPEPIADLAPVHGVVIQKSRPGHRRATKRYVD